MTMIIFTDIDGTLLDPVTYSPKAAEPALDAIRRKDIPVVFVSSKTRAEIEPWRVRLDNSHPFVVENGGGIYIPDGYFRSPEQGRASGGYRVLSLGTPYGQVRKRFEELRSRLQAAVRGFGDMTVDEVADRTGLRRGEAELAKQRDYTEPFVFSGRVDERFLREIEGEKLRWTQGQFFHLMGDHHKGRAVDILRRLFERENGGTVTSVGIGDSLNDLPFLLSVDKPVLVRKKSGKYDARVQIPGLVRTQGRGPEGWNQAVLALLGA